MKSKIDTLAIDMALLRTDQNKPSDRISQTELTLVDLTPKMVETQNNMVNMQEGVRFLNSGLRIPKAGHEGVISVWLA